MRRLLGRMRCWFTEHDTQIHWGPVFRRPGEKADREVREVCTRCGVTLHTTTFRREGEKWSA